MRRVLILALACGLALGLAAPASAQMVVHTVSVTTDASGNATVYSQPTFGVVVAVRYVPGTSALDNATTVTITDNGTDLQALSVSSLGPSARDFWPRAFTMSTTGVVALYAAGGTNVLDLVPVAGAIKVVVSGGGNAKSGTFYVYVEGR